MPHDANKFRPVVPPSPSRAALRERVAKIIPLGRETVTVALDGEPPLEFEVRSPPAGVRWKLEQFGFNEAGTGVLPTRFFPDLLIQTVYDPASGERVWEDTEQELVAALDVRVTRPLTTAALKVCGWAKDDAENATDGVSRVGTAGNPSAGAPETGFGAAFSSPASSASAPLTS